MLAQDFNELGYIANRWPLDAARPTLLLIHGAGMNHAQWEYQLSGLKEAANVLAVDLPGHALSAHHDGTQSIAGYADILAELAVSLDCDQLIMAGHSMGGAVCLDFALRYPDLLQGMILVNTGGRLRVMPELMQQIESDYSGFVRSLSACAIGASQADRVTEPFAELMMQSELQAVLNDFAACDHFDRLADLDKIRCPALVISSDGDIMTPPKYGRFLADHLSGGQYELIENASHIAPMEQPEAVNAAIARFLLTLHPTSAI